MKQKGSDWYKYGWSLDVKNQSWTEDTENQVDFIINALQLKGNERILDLACGYGRHSLSFAKRGFSVVGIDITKAYIEDAVKIAAADNVDAEFIQGDIRDAHYDGEFDVVLNLADGAIGYLENDEENLKIFDVIARALKKGGRHFMDVCSAEYAEHYFPKTNWEAGEKALSLAQFDWNSETHRMLYGGCDIPYGAIMEKPDIPAGDPIRLYSIKELEDIFKKRGMKIENAFSDYHGNKASYKNIQLLVSSVKL